MNLLLDGGLCFLVGYIPVTHDECGNGEQVDEGDKGENDRFRQEALQIHQGTHVIPHKVDRKQFKWKIRG